MDSDKRILIMAGGTGGHVFPALAVAKYLAQLGWQVQWLGTAERMEAKLVPQHGFDINFIDIKGVRGNGLIRKLTAPIKILRSIIQARAVIKKFKPDVVLGMGGFASGPGGVAARLSGVPLVLHEQNAIAGMTNKLLSHIANRVLVAFDGTFEQGESLVGNPIRAELIKLGEEQKSIHDDGSLKLLVVGGSLGAQILNKLLPEVTEDLSRQHSITVWHQVGRDNLPAVFSEYKARGQDINTKVVEFIDDMEGAYRWADLIICRSGALTVSELAAVGLASILVPYPHAVDDHQTKNAQILVDAGASILLPQSEMDSVTLSAELARLASNRELLQQMGKKARDVAVTDATQKVASVCIELAEGSK